MGSWGYGILDNDSGSEFATVDNQRAMYVALKLKRPREYVYERARVAVFFVVAVARGLNQDIGLSDALACVDKMLADEDYKPEWQHVVKEQRREVQVAIRLYEKRSGLTIRPRGVLYGPRPRRSRGATGRGRRSHARVGVGE